MKKLIVAILTLTILIHLNGHAQDQVANTQTACELHSSAHLSCVYFEGNINSQAYSSPAILEIQRLKTNSSKNSSSTHVLLHVNHSMKIKDFDFNRFEGPGAVASRAKNLEIKVLTGNKYSIFNWFVSGFYAADSSSMGFVFQATNAHLSSKREMNRFLELLTAPDASIEISLRDKTDNKYKNRFLKARFTMNETLKDEVKKMLESQQ